jgi:opacity protein-like surface antigen
MKTPLQQLITNSLLALALCFPALSSAEELEDGPSLGAIFGDVVFARPVLFAITAVGTALYVVSLPVTLLTGNAGDAGDALVMTPAAATFTRCLGCTNKDQYSSYYEDETESTFKDYTDNQDSYSASYEKNEVSDPLGIYIFAGVNSSLSFGVDDSNGYQAGIGYSLINGSWGFVNIEAAYLSTGDVDDVTTGQNEVPTFERDLVYKTNSLLLGTKVGLNLGSYVSTYLKYGVNKWNLEFDRVANETEHESGSSNYYGLGFGFNLSRNLSLNLEYIDADYGKEILEYDNNIASTVGNITYTF